MTEIVIVCHAHVAKVVRVERVASCVSVDRWEKEVPWTSLPYLLIVIRSARSALILRYLFFLEFS